MFSDYLKYVVSLVSSVLNVLFFLTISEESLDVRKYFIFV